MAWRHCAPTNPRLGCEDAREVHPTGLVKPDDADAKVKFLAAEALRGVPRRMQCECFVLYSLLVILHGFALQFFQFSFDDPTQSCLRCWFGGRRPGRISDVLRWQVGGILLDANGKRFANELGRRDYVPGRELLVGIEPER